MRIIQDIQVSDGHKVIVLGTAPDTQPLRAEIVKVLEEVWIGDIAYGEDIEDYIDALMEFGVDLYEEVRTRGMDDPFADRKDRLIKDRGDVAEVLGYLRETMLRGIPADDMFAPILWTKLKGGLTTHGLDGLGFIWRENIGDSRMILCEWKHTTQTESIRDPCSSAHSEWSTLTLRRLLQELRRVMRIYRARGEIAKVEFLKWFAHLWAKRDQRVTCVTMVVYPDTISINRARRGCFYASCEEVCRTPAQPNRTHITRM